MAGEDRKKRAVSKILSVVARRLDARLGVGGGAGSQTQGSAHAD